MTGAPVQQAGRRFRAAKLILLLLAVLPPGVEVCAQESPFLLPLRWPRSVWGMGMGQQGSAMGDAGESFAYNPALLARATDISASLFRFPVYSWCCDPIPIHAVTVTSPLPADIGYVGVEYIRMAYPRIQRHTEETVEYPYVTPTLHSLSLGYARPVAQDVHAGVALRYNVWTDDLYHVDDPFYDVHFVLFSAGVTWTPMVVDRKIHIGFSLMDLGQIIEPTSLSRDWNGDAPPAALRFGIGVPVIDDAAVAIPLMIEVSKPLEGYDDDNYYWRRVSSFSALFKDWNEFPRDATLHTGIGFEWKPLDLGNDVSFFQRIAIGNYSTGPKAGPYNVFTLSAQAGFAYKGIEVEAGMGAVWQYLPLESWFLSNKVPREMFEFTLRAPAGIISGEQRSASPAFRLDRVIVSAGAFWTTHDGEYPNSDISTLNDDISFDGGAALYLNADHALVASLSVEHLSVQIRNLDDTEDRPFISESMSMIRYTAQYRWHPLESVHALYLQGGGGATLLNTESAVSWRGVAYGSQHLSSIQPVFVAAFGMLFPVADFVIEPQAEFSVLLNSITSDAPLHLGGFKAARFGVRLGYAVK